ncbi:threonine/homoserine/homoserine lactone efflux protein [Lysinibacillus composti]|uniref:LysE family translocator n=1 Tax=Lysinibacillus composti TaxID=720633 RepID=A0A3N9UE00_9BACI|nr:LysE family translocator [Lysinibacillus composti]MBM7608923.1 threonine/homoserine/homoserine lactone efflux protein [Lysinibacillus composti]RQW74500.1 LysE family translocator [Lysinibacillus composti]
MELLSIISFLGAAIVLTLMPGPDNLFTLAQSMAKGKNAGIYTTLGLCTGLLVHITAATIGISALIYQSAFAFTVVKYAGAAYLLFLAYKSFREKDSSFNLKHQDNLDYRSLYKKGVIMNLLNPKVSLFFLAFFPQFINYENGNVSAQMLGLGILFLIQTLVIFTLISIFAGKVGEFLRKNTSISKKMNMIQGSLFTLIGLKIAFSEK